MSRPKTLLITGGSGYLGRHLALVAAESYTVHTTYWHQPDQITAGNPVPLDITSRDAVFDLVSTLQPQAIIHTAAANPGKDEQLMEAINTNGSRYIAEAAVATNARLVHVSTDALHDGRHAPYMDDAPANPLNSYGQTKAAAEQWVRSIDPNAAIVRTSLIYGLKEMDRGTVGFAQRLAEGKRLLLFNDVIRQPVWVESLSEALLKLVEVELGGLLNVAGRQPLTREEFGRKMLNFWQVETGNQLGTGRAADISDKIPLDSRLLIEKGEALLNMRFPGVDEVLQGAV